MSKENEVNMDWLVVQSSEVSPDVLKAREQWQDKQIWCLAPWGQWRRGKVRYIADDGYVAVRIYKHGSWGYAIGYTLEDLATKFKLVEW